MARFGLLPGEQLLHEGTVGYVRSRLKLVPGVGHLTDRRFVHTNKTGAMALGGVLGALSKGSVDLEVRFDEVSGLARQRHGRNGSILAIVTENGLEHRLLCPFDEWFGAFRNALLRHPTTTLLERAPGQWSVER